jgi:peptidoglycan/LPS O-acetylase OafA/YrhL
MRFGFTYGNEAGSIVSRSDWLGIFIKFEPEFWRVIKYSFSDVFFKHSTETSYNPFLWTMSIELAGSFFLFATLPILKYLKNRIAFALSAALYLFLSDSIYAMFFIGLFFALLRVDSNFIQKIRFKNFLGLLILLLVVAYDNNLWRMHGNYDDYTNRVMSIMAIYLLFAILLSQKMQKIFTMSLSKFLGKISFALYLVQFPVIMSYTSYLILFFNEKYSYISFAQANFIIFSSVGLSVIFAIPFASLEVLLINKINDLVGRYLLTYEGA